MNTTDADQRVTRPHVVVVFSGQIEQGDHQQHAQRYDGFILASLVRVKPPLHLQRYRQGHLFMGIAIMLDC
ncbi:MAG: hypothetical protein ACOH2T_22025 [Pseudomonas sp.]